MDAVASSFRRDLETYRTGALGVPPPAPFEVDCPPRATIRTKETIGTNRTYPAVVAGCKDADAPQLGNLQPEGRKNVLQSIQYCDLIHAREHEDNDRS